MTNRASSDQLAFHYYQESSDALTHHSSSSTGCPMAGCVFLSQISPLVSSLHDY